MGVLLLRLAGPMQAWGVRSRFTVRETELAPTKSGILGILAAAAGRRRTDPVEDLLTLRFGVRKDQPGRVIRDFHTARSLDGKDSMPLSDRYYLADAVFLAGIEGEADLLEGMEEALRHPRFPLYLGRRSCVPSQPVAMGLREGSLLEALRQEAWQASQWYRRRRGWLEAEILIDAEATPEEERSGDLRGSRDVPLSFDPRRREYSFREVERHHVVLGEPRGDTRDPLGAAQEGRQRDPHDPMLELEEAQTCS
ncbi:type I-E CRISPR-associated protein Cas5/CasD [Actinomyces wuliandei]|uniref:type I-E CRISPR-associated protein Cas5/CasD n=1 Tax=Actinomyces wuliandei TaxID=2057743 RepID=UPI000FDCB6BF|nr:type I-E CRISPR-associated protein Cas5/CasD [Actinomyces wuliandei]